jgi:uncharacterized protein (TIGR03435 family)
MNAAGMLNHLWQSTEFAGLAALVALALRKNAARVRFGVWLGASLKFLVPFSALAAAGSALASRLPWPQASTALPAVTAAAHFETVVIPITVSSLPQASGVPWAWILGGLWLAGSGALAGRWWLQWRRTARLARKAEPRAASGMCLRVTEGAVEPGVFGILRPVLLVPVGIEDQLTAEQLEAVLAHERTHIRRRDNLWAALHRVVETMFWFHPFVWWIGARMIAERERACDEAVLRAGGDARAYAGGILGVCRHYMDAPLACASGVSGGPLQRRVREILEGGWGRNLSRKGLTTLAALLAVALLGPVAAGMIYAQSGPTEFAAASIRPGEQPGPARKISFGMRVDPQRLTAENMSLKDLITRAYGLRPYQVVGPDWMTTERFNVTGTTTAPVAQDKITELLQPFLVRQFGIKMHRETKTMPVYLLEMAPGGPKMSPESSSLPGAEGHIALAPAAASLGRFMMRLSPQGLNLVGTATMEQMARVLSLQLDFPVVNKTSLTGVYKIDLTFSTPDGRVTMGGLPHVPQMDGQTMKMTAPSIFTALPEQVGLMLEKTKAPLELLVIDSANKTPLGN